MKKSIKIITITIIILLVIFIISIPFVNDYTAANISKKIEKIALPDDTTYIESISRAGKMVGNGNGMQYYGAIRIESGLTIDEIEEYYSECSDLKIEVEEQDDNTYLVYSWGKGIKPFNILDIRGH